MHNEIKSLGSSICGELEMFCPLDLICTGRREALKFLGSRLSLAVHIEEDVGLGFRDCLLVRQRHRAVVEMEPAPFVSRVCRVMPRTDPGNASTQNVKGRPLGLRLEQAGGSRGQRPHKGRSLRPLHKAGHPRWPLAPRLSSRTPVINAPTG